MVSDGNGRGEMRFQGGRGAGASHEDHLELASRYEEQGRLPEAVYQLLTAYESAQNEFQGSFLFEGHPALEGLRHAWDLSCQMESQSLAVHVFGLIEPYLSLDEVGRCSDELERLSTGPFRSLSAEGGGTGDGAGFPIGDFIKAAAEEGSAIARALAGREAASASRPDGGEKAAASGGGPLGPGSCTYDSLVGFDDEITLLRNRGFGPPGDGRQRDFLRQMSVQHGIEAAPPSAVTVFRSPAREDADSLMLAAAAELDLPTIRMRVDEGAFGNLVLCIIAANGFDGKAGAAMNGFPGPGVLVLEGIDAWGVPGQQPGALQDEVEFQGAFLSRGAYKALGFIRSAVLNPDVTVLASMSSGYAVDGELADLLGGVEFIDVPLPNGSERDAIWDRLMDDHASLSALDRFELVRLTANMPRCDIQAAAREAVEQAFRESVERQRYQPVTRGNVLDKIAAYQPLESAEYREIEDSLVDDLLEELERYDQDRGRGGI